MFYFLPLACALYQECENIPKLPKKPRAVKDRNILFQLNYTYSNIQTKRLMYDIEVNNDELMYDSRIQHGGLAIGFTTTLLQLGDTLSI